MQSKAEFSVAKHGYVETRSGWFSERSACYLACGRQVLVQDTGFTKWLATGRASSHLQHWMRHCRASRRSIRAISPTVVMRGEVAEAYFESGKVLRRLLAGIQSRQSANNL